ncbi:helix-turn-helix domain-containing protein [Halalkalicoccus jeotgali]|uniref:Bacterio-opsin activator HTH domain protein n=1 Tax=Halalkalicoccus jeotgali (strain DSM 18796 / CECT 7217 / JCM 14584 / KCTC 4019 / B3) TaxID=795797 RepID=D8J9Q4_HALJB|nr:helix-turn-helix domain-containing protein [Halalkalicoccus jeotgali]ADJ16393.1 Bacterio-opsin activator HTH domain protein [Halalkalicoccus jeotgali B3]ELY37127.1 bacterio-opsin activator HTH domain-containing protein [Halalkalicoccus jeotgali B3]
MTEARLAVTLPEGVWIADVTTAHPETTVRVLAAMPGENVGFGLARVEEPGVDAVLEGMDAAADVTSLSVLRRGDRGALVQFETTQPLLVLSARESGIALEPPVEIHEGVATVEVTASRERLSELGEQLRAFGLGFEVEYVREGSDRERVLTDRQREVLLMAVEAGYYETPRRCSLTDLAAALGVAKSTASETLHRAEGAVIERFAAERFEETSL